MLTVFGYFSLVPISNVTLSSVLAFGFERRGFSVDQAGVCLPSAEIKGMAITAWLSQVTFYLVNRYSCDFPTLMFVNE